MNTEFANAYSNSGAAWAIGPARIYSKLARVLLGCSPIELSGATLLDLGAGTGAASRAAAELGAHTFALDMALGMLRAGPHSRAVVGDACALPFRDNAFDAVVAAFSLNHLPQPRVALEECVRATKPGGIVLASAYAKDDFHPIKQAVEDAARNHGWTAPAWRAEFSEKVAPILSTAEGFQHEAAAASLDAEVRNIVVSMDEVTPEQLVDWRLGMPWIAPFADALDPDERLSLAKEAVMSLPDCPPLKRSMLVLIAHLK